VTRIHANIIYRSFQEREYVISNHVTGILFRASSIVNTIEVTRCPEKFQKFTSLESNTKLTVVINHAVGTSTT
jgi:hypothetical protein